MEESESKYTCWFVTAGGKWYEVSEILSYTTLGVPESEGGPWVELTLKYNPDLPAFARASSLKVRTRG